MLLMSDRILQILFPSSSANKSNLNAVTGFPKASSYCKHEGSVTFGSVLLGVVFISQM